MRTAAYFALGAMVAALAGCAVAEQGYLTLPAPLEGEMVAEGHVCDPRALNPLPNAPPLVIAGVEHAVLEAGGFKSGIGTVLADQQVRGAPDVDLGITQWASASWIWCAYDAPTFGAGAHQPAACAAADEVIQ